MGVILLVFQFSLEFEVEMEDEMIDIGMIFVLNEERRFVFLREIYISENQMEESFKFREFWVNEVE